MKATDDYAAKLRWCAEHPKVVPLPPGPALPRFACRRFRTHAEMNRWKEARLREAAKQAADRPQDQSDIAFLLELQRLGKLR